MRRGVQRKPPPPPRTPQSNNELNLMPQVKSCLKPSRRTTMFMDEQSNFQYSGGGYEDLDLGNFLKPPKEPPRTKTRPSSNLSKQNLFKGPTIKPNMNYYQGETFLSNPERVRKEVKQLTSRVNQTTTGSKFAKQQFTSSSGDNFAYSDIDAELRSILKDKPKEDHSYKTIQRKIQTSREQWKKLREVANAKKNNYEPPIRRELSPQDTETIVSEKLAEISRQFRESLKLSSERTLQIQTPKHNVNVKKFPKQINQKANEHYRSLTEKANAVMRLNSERSIDSFQWDVEKFGEFPETEKFSKAKVNPSGKIVPSHAMRKRIPLVKSRHSADKNDSTLNLAGIVKFRSLLDANTSELFSSKVNAGGLDEHRRAVDPNYPHPPLEDFIGPPKNMDPYMATLQAMREKRDRELKLEMSQTPTTSSTITPEIKKPNPGKTVRISSDVQYVRNPFKAAAYAEISADNIQNRIVDSVQTLETAANVASAAGSLLMRVAATRDMGVGGDEVQDPTLFKSFLESRDSSGGYPITSTTDYYESETTETESGDENGREIQTQTDDHHSFNYPMRQPIPIKVNFKRDMSEADQRRLEELRARKHEWEGQVM